MTRFGTLLLSYCAVAAVTIPAFVRPTPRLVWNASASVPVGLYAARAPSQVEVGDLVAAHAPAPVAQLMAGRGYLPLRVPMLKHVAALPGQSVCRLGAAILIDGKRAAHARLRDRLGRPLPRWSGCRTLRKGEVLLLNPASPDSFDGRYFGPMPASGIVAVLDPLWLPRGSVSAPAKASDAHKSPPQPTTKGANDDQNR